MQDILSALNNLGISINIDPSIALNSEKLDLLSNALNDLLDSQKNNVKIKSQIFDLIFDILVILKKDRLTLPLNWVSIFIEFLGDSKERIRESASKCLVQVYLDLHNNQKNAVAIAMVEQKLIRSIVSLNPRCRETSIRSLINVVSQNPCVKVGVYVTALCESLEDKETTVRSSAKDCLAFLYSITKSHQLKLDVIRETTRLGVRASIIESLEAEMSKFDAKQVQGESLLSQDVQDSILLLPTKTISPKSKQTNASTSLIQSQVNTFTSFFVDKETEQNWSDRDAAIVSFTAFLDSLIESKFECPTDNPAFYDSFKPLIPSILITLPTLRTSLLFTTLQCLYSLSSFLGSTIPIAFSEAILPSLVGLCITSKKLILKRLLACITHWCEKTKIWSKQSSFGSYLISRATDKSSNLRQVCINLIANAIETCGSLPNIANSVLEKVVVKAITDSDATVRKFARDGIFVYTSGDLEWVERLLDGLDSNTTKFVFKYFADKLGLDKPHTKKSVRIQKRVSTPVTAFTAAPAAEAPDVQEGSDNLNEIDVDDLQLQEKPNQSSMEPEEPQIKESGVDFQGTFSVTDKSSPKSELSDMEQHVVAISSPILVSKRPFNVTMHSRYSSSEPEAGKDAKGDLGSTTIAGDLNMRVLSLLLAELSDQTTDGVELENVIGRLFRLVQKHRFQSSIQQILSKLLVRLDPAECTISSIDALQSSLILLSDIICQEVPDSQKAASMLDLVFIYRSHGSPNISGPAHECLLALLRQVDSHSITALLIDILSRDLDNVDGPGYKVHQLGFEGGQFQPTPVVSCLTALKIVISSMTSSELLLILEDGVLLRLLQMGLVHEFVTVRKACYEGLVACLKVIGEVFWGMVKERLSEQQVVLVSCMVNV